MTWLRLHGQALAAALARLAAQPLGSLISVLVLAVAIALPLLAGMALRSVAAAAASLDTEPHVNVYLAPSAGDDEAKRVEAALRANADAARVRFIPRQQALDEMRKTTHLADLLAALDRNPLPHAFTVRLRPEAVGRVEALRTAWAALPAVDQVVADFEWAERLGRWVRLGDRLLALLAGLLAAAVAFIVAHLIRLQVVTRRQEIEVSQLVGATAADVRRPFLYHGFAQGILAGVAAVALAAALGAWVGAEVRALAPSYAAELKDNFLPLGYLAGTVGGAALLGLLGAWVAVNRELRRFTAAG